jgi:hypothetical protein
MSQFNGKSSEKAAPITPLPETLIPNTPWGIVEYILTTEMALDGMPPDMLPKLCVLTLNSNTSTQRLSVNISEGGNRVAIEGYPRIDSTTETPDTEDSTTDAPDTESDIIFPGRPRPDSQQLTTAEYCFKDVEDEAFTGTGKKLFMNKGTSEVECNGTDQADFVWQMREVILNRDPRAIAVFYI